LEDETDDETDAEETSSHEEEEEEMDDNKTVGLPNDIIFHERVNCSLSVEND